MIRLLFSTSLLAMTLASNSVYAELGAEHEHEDDEHGYKHDNFKPKKYDSLGKCLEKAFKKHDGKVVKLEYTIEKKVAVYEFDIQTLDGKAWEIECRVNDSKLIEIEEEVKSYDIRFIALAKITKAQAKDIALAAHPGTVTEIEYELESDGKASYEIDILEKNGETVKVEVDATSGKIVEVSYEGYQIGYK